MKTASLVASVSKGGDKAPNIAPIETAKAPKSAANSYAANSSAAPTDTAKATAPAELRA